MDYLLRLLIAAGLGSLIGLERQWHQRFAGLRTNALVALGAAAFTGAASSPLVASNAGPFLGQIITGIGFLGAGVIFKEGFNVRGLNTAATIWCSAAVGMLSGLGLTTEALEVAMLVILINLLLRRLALSFSQSQPDSSAEMESVYRLHGVCARRGVNTLRGVLLAQAAGTRALVRELHSENAGKGLSRLSADLVVPGRNDHLIEDLVGRLGLESGVHSLRWELISSATRFE